MVFWAFREVTLVNYPCTDKCYCLPKMVILLNLVHSFDLLRFHLPKDDVTLTPSIYLALFTSLNNLSHTLSSLTAAMSYVKGSSNGRKGNINTSLASFIFMIVDASDTENVPFPPHTY